MMAHVTDNGTVSQAFAMTDRVKQDCVLVPTLFSVVVSDMPLDARRYERPVIHIAYRMDGQLLNHQRMHFQSRESTAAVRKLLFVDNCALNVTTEEDMQRSIDFFTSHCAHFGLTINTANTVVMHQQVPNDEYSVPRIHVNGIKLKTSSVISPNIVISPNSVTSGRQERCVMLWVALTGSIIYKANRIAVPKAKREARQPQAYRLLSAKSQRLLTSPGCQHTFHERFGLVEHLRTQCTYNLATPTSSTTLFSPANAATTTIPAISGHTIVAPPPSIPLSSDPPRLLRRLQLPGPPTSRHLALPPPVGQHLTSHHLLLSPPASPPPTIWT
ncbi:hypothetical protein SprV_0200807800 [Sparganum proliferum]